MNTSASRPVVALCVWEDYDYRFDRKPCDPIFIPREGEPNACRASLGDRILTVWLPQGAKIRRRLPRFRADDFDPMTQTFRYIFGSHDRCSRTRIQIKLTAMPCTGTPQ